MSIAGLLIFFALLLFAMSLHEFSHGWVAYKLGDTTAKFQGRLTLNPLAHIDPMGTVVLPLLIFIMSRGQFIFGAAKPVPINYWALKNPRRDMIWIGFAGPLSNLLCAAAVSLGLRLLPQATVLSEILTNFVLINVILGVFNLVPIPPLDGSRIIMGVLPEQLARSYAGMERFGFIIIIILFATGILNLLVWPLVNLITGILLGA